MSRLASGGLVDRSQPIGFTFDGRRYAGFAGDTLASALIANDVRLVGRSFKYHRPRGILTAGSEEPNALVTLHDGIDAEPNSRATTIALFDGLVATSQNRWPSLRFDLMAVNQLAAPLFVAGFYYKTFMWPAALWEKLYEPLIRRAAGLGTLSTEPDPAHYDRTHAFCDVLVIGGGPSGMSAALAAGRAGLRVILADEDFAPGGKLLAERHWIDGLPGQQWARNAAAELESLPNVRLLSRTTVFGVYDGREYGAVERLSERPARDLGAQPRQRLWKIVARHAVLATGAIERPLLFGGNDRPGVMTASAVSTYLNRFAAAPGQRAVVFTTGDSGWATAEDLLAAGVDLAAVIDVRKALPAAATRLRAAGVKIFANAAVTDVSGRSVRAVTIRDGKGASRRVHCDLVAMAGGWNPAIGLASNLGDRPVWSPAIGSFLIGSPPPGMQAIGAAAGQYSLAEAMMAGTGAAMAILAKLGRSMVVAPPPVVTEGSTEVAAPWVGGAHRGKAFVDFQNDVTDRDVALAAREGFVSIEHLKRYTTLGMATDQGKTGQINGHAVLAAATGKPIAELGTVLSRPPYLPVSVGVLAGHHRGAHFRPVRLTASHGWAVDAGASFTDAGQWKRAQWYARPGEVDWRESVDREVNATRRSVGICDVSTLGKIDVLGPDAGTLLDRLYINMFSTLAIGKARYGVMLREDGFVMDDGTTTRFAEDRFFLTTTTVNAARVMQHIDYCRQVIWPELDVQATSVTEHWSTYSVAGPNARALLQAAFPELDLGNEHVPFMGAAEFRWQGVTARICRLSFSGELAYEVSAPSWLGERLIRHLLDAGRRFDATPYGTEALGVMRIEKGHPAGGELNGQTTAGDLGFARMMSTKKDFIGRIMAARPALVDAERPSLVGLRPVSGNAPIRAGGHLLAMGREAVIANDEGHVTSAAYSPTLGHPIALALLKRGPGRHGERIRVHDPVRGPDVEVEVCDPVFVDPEGLRVRG